MNLPIDPSPTSVVNDPKVRTNLPQSSDFGFKAWTRRISFASDCLGSVRFKARSRNLPCIFCLKNSLLSENKLENGNRAEPSAHYFLAETSDKRLSAQYLRPNIQPIYHLAVTPTDVIVQIDYGLSVLPASKGLEQVESGMTASSIGALRPIIEPLKERFDYIIIDTPPGKSYLAVSALVASDSVLIPLEPPLSGNVRLRRNHE